jgi:hypothetical protein
MNRDKKRNFIALVKRGKINKDDFIGNLKYEQTQEQRDYILNKLPNKFTNIAYNNPLPKDEKDLCKVEGYFWSSQPSLLKELTWYFDVLKKYSKNINDYLIIKDDIEITILNKDIQECNKLLDKLDNEVCCSFFALQTELYINEISNNSIANKELIKNFPIDKTSSKLLFLLDFSRLRVDKNIAYWQYDSTIEQHKKEYPKESESLVNYVDYKLNPVRYEESLSELTFLTYFDSDFSVIDRYNSLKNLLSIILFENTLKKDERDFIILKITEFSEIFNDSYWEKLLLLIDDNYNEFNATEDYNSYFEVQDLYLVGDYHKVIEKCNSIFKKQSNFSDLFIFYAKSMIFSDKNLGDNIDNKTELFEILQLIINILLKNDNYIANRDKLLEKYYLISHFDFSTPLLEFLYNEFKLTRPKGVRYLTFLKGKVFRYNAYSLFDIQEKYTKLKITNNAHNHIKNILNNHQIKVNGKHFFEFKLKIGTLIYKRKGDEAISELINFKTNFSDLINNYKFIETWYNKTCLKCYFQISDLKKVSNLIVQAFFKNNIAYDHFFDQKFITAFNKLEDEDIFDDISIPILFEIYNQPQSSIYDRIADFLIFNNVKKPSEIFDLSESFDSKLLVHFLEKVCTKDNIQDSPFLNSVEELEAERIIILNKLKLINIDKIELYNVEILALTKGASLRKGLLQIHESRIYVDTTNIKKHLGVELPEIFDRYLELTDITYSAISSLKLNENLDKDSIVVTFYLKEPIPEIELPNYLTNRDVFNDSNAVTVPVIRFTYFLNIFNAIRQEFIFNEDYGFKSFLSMRIRHGTFSNVLRSVFDKYDLISSKESSSEDYTEIEYWNKNLQISSESKSLIQVLLKDFSKNIDSLIDSGLSWISVKNENGENNNGVFDFSYSQDMMYALYHNRMGKIENYDLFFEETFSVLYERLDKNLNTLREKITRNLSTKLLLTLEKLQDGISEVVKKGDELNPIEQKIISCKTDLQLIIPQINKWFNISKNQYIEEFPIDMIVQNSLDYINSIHTHSIQNASVKTTCKCSSNFKGKYFEIFGDMLINIFDNIVSKNKDLGNELKIDINIKQVNESIELVIKNNISNSTDKNILKERVKKIIKNVTDYKKEGINSSFEEGSGFLKICKCISVDLERDNYEVVPKIVKNNFEVKINFELKELIV